MVEIKYFCFAAYVMIKFFTGIILNSFGPIIIYYAKVTHQDETYFSFIFITKAVGYITGGLLTKILVKHFSYHQLLATTISICSIALIVSSINFGFWNLSITMFLIGASGCVLEIICNLCIFDIFFRDHQDYWFQFANLFFPIGGFVGPLIAVQTQQLGLRADGILLLLCLTPILMLDSPQKQIKLREQDEQLKKYLLIPTSIEIQLCLIIFIFYGLAVYYPSWAPTYAVKSGALNQVQANTLVSIYWIVNLISKIIMLFLKNSVESRIFVQLNALVISSTITIVLQMFGYFEIVCYFGVISISFFSSGLYALFFAIGPQYGYKLTPSNLAHLTIFTCLGEGLLVTPIGYAMGYFGFQAFAYCTFIGNCLMFAVFAYTNCAMIKDSKQQIQNEQSAS